MRTINVGYFRAAVVLCVLTGASVTTLRAAQDATPGSATPVATVAVVRHVFISDEPESAPGETLALVEYTIAAGAVLPVHTHPGVQMATVESGTLTYHVIERGRVTISRADGTDEIVGPGETAIFEVGDSWVEPEGMVHYAENLTTEPIVLLSTSLLAEDEPPTELVETTPTS